MASGKDFDTKEMQTQTFDSHRLASLESKLAQQIIKGSLPEYGSPKSRNLPLLKKH